MRLTLCSYATRRPSGRGTLTTRINRLMIKGEANCLTQRRGSAHLRGYLPSTEEMASKVAFITPFDDMGLKLTSSEQREKFLDSSRAAMTYIHEAKNAYAANDTAKLQRMEAGRLLLHDEEARRRFEEVDSDDSDTLLGKRQEHEYSVFGPNRPPTMALNDTTVGSFSNFREAFEQVSGMGYEKRIVLESSPGTHVTFNLLVPLRDGLFGCSRELVYRRDATCATCSGDGKRVADTKATCLTCKGRGALVLTSGSYRIEKACRQCNGEGTRPARVCPTCDGYGINKQEARLTVRVPPGVEHGEALFYANRGNEGLLQGKTGDLVVNVYLEDHPTYERVGSELHCIVPITLSMALLGGETTIVTLEGRKLRLHVPAGTNHGDVSLIRSCDLFPLPEGTEVVLHYYVGIPSGAKMTVQQLGAMERFVAEERDAMREAFDDEKPLWDQRKEERDAERWSAAVGYNDPNDIHLRPFTTPKKSEAAPVLSRLEQEHEPVNLRGQGWNPPRVDQASLPYASGPACKRHELIAEYKSRYVSWLPEQPEPPTDSEDQAHTFVIS